MVLFNNNPISVTPPNHVILKIEYAEPAVRGNTATNLTKPVKLESRKSKATRKGFPVWNLEKFTRRALAGGWNWKSIAMTRRFSLDRRRDGASCGLP